MRKAFVAVALVLAGCATTTGVQPGPDGSFTITRLGNSLLATTADLKSQAMQAAATHCGATGKRVRVIYAREIPAVGSYPRAEVSFACQ
jgi:hypothetical protein